MDVNNVIIYIISYISSACARAGGGGQEGESSHKVVLMSHRCGFRRTSAPSRASAIRRGWTEPNSWGGGGGSHPEDEEGGMMMSSPHEMAARAAIAINKEFIADLPPKFKPEDAERCRN